MIVLSCEELRKAKLGDPKRMTLRMRLHLLLCPKCACFSDKADVLEKDLGEALRIDVPETLVERMVTKCGAASAANACAGSASWGSRILAALRRIFGTRQP